MQISRFRTPRKLLNSTKTKHFGGRNNQGRITIRHQGGGHKQILRQIDWTRKFTDTKAVVVEFDYDPNRTVPLAKLCHFNSNDIQEAKKNINHYSYILAPKGLKMFATVQTVKEHWNKDSLRFPFHPGDASYISNFKPGNAVHCVEAIPGNGALFARSAGTSCQILQYVGTGRYTNYVRIRLPSKDQRLVPPNVLATYGVLSNEHHRDRNLLKAGRSRWLGIRPSVRGVAMNPVDHPHGGGQGKTKGGRPSVTPSSRPTKGQPTRSKRKKNKLILEKHHK